MEILYIREDFLVGKNLEITNEFNKYNLEIGSYVKYQIIINLKIKE